MIGPDIRMNVRDGWNIDQAAPQPFSDGEREVRTVAHEGEVFARDIDRDLGAGAQKHVFRAEQVERIR